MAVNKVFLAGLVSKNDVRFYDGKTYGYLNLVISGLPVVVKYGGKNYDGSRVQTLCDSMKSGNDSYARIAEGYIQERSSKARKGGWEVAGNSGMDRFTLCDPVELNFTYLSGKVTSMDKDSQDASWVELAIPYWSRRPGTDGEEKTRTGRVKLPSDWTADITNREVSVWGALKNNSGGTEMLHVEATAITVH